MARAAWTTRGSIPAFVRVAAVCVALVNAVVLISWGGLELLAGDGASPLDALPSVFVALVSGLVTAQVVLWWFELPGPGPGHLYKVVAASLGIGGAVMGEMLGWLWVLDGTLGAGTFAGVLAQDAPAVLATFVYALVPGFVGAVVGFVIGLVEGLALAFPLAAALNRYGDRG